MNLNVKRKTDVKNSFPVTKGQHGILEKIMIRGKNLEMNPILLNYIFVFFKVTVHN